MNKERLERLNDRVAKGEIRLCMTCNDGQTRQVLVREFLPLSGGHRYIWRCERNGEYHFQEVEEE
jgi:hypothetical protein